MLHIHKIILFEYIPCDIQTQEHAARCRMHNASPCIDFRCNLTVLNGDGYRPLLLLLFANSKAIKLPFHRNQTWQTHKGTSHQPVSPISRMQSSRTSNLPEQINTALAILELSQRSCSNRAALMCATFEWNSLPSEPLSPFKFCIQLHQCFEPWQLMSRSRQWKTALRIKLGLQSIPWCPWAHQPCHPEAGYSSPFCWVHAPTSNSLQTLG